ncbi:integrase catalytic domain-containing protein [Hymenobacter sp. IS2118]|uniref:integrase catalytic domain-containing protein n=1 Tax=Hymenobacter sp. IS2118 TaxID=1505605 RepID=UPI000AA5FC4D|nr:DDE-type integrase/transposase/recombinase [Hymenobacter sp. IS2118]
MRQAVEKGWAAYKQPFVLALGMTNEGHAAAEPLARLQAALEWCLQEVPRAYSLREVLPAFQSLGLIFCPEQGARGGEGAYASLSRKLSQYRAAPNKTAYLLAKRGAPRGNRNRRKMEEAHMKWLIKYFKKDEKPTKEQTHLAYLAYREATRPDWPVLSVRTVGNLLKERKPAWFGGRHGKAAAHKELGYKILKKLPGFPDLLIEFDGTNEPLTFINEAGKEVTNLYSVRVWDVHSGCIVGSAYGFTETADLVLAALQDYFTRWGRVPRQFRFDKGAANTSGRVQALLEKTGAIAFASEAGRPTARRSEQLLGQFQKTVQRKLPWWRGPNITSNANLDLQANPERLAAAQQERVSVAAVVARCRACEVEWNNRCPGARAAERRSPMERYLTGAETAAKLTLGDLANLLYVKRQRPVTFTSTGLKIEVEAVDYVFEPQDADFAPDQAACFAANGHAFEVWEAQDGSREQVLVRRADGKGDWQVMGRKYAYSESLLELRPGDAERRRQTVAGSKTLLADLATVEPEPEPAEALGAAELGHTGLSKNDWNAVNAEAETARALPTGRRQKPATVAAALPVAHRSMSGAEWDSGPEGRLTDLEVMD